MPTATVFDLDETLADSAAAWQRAIAAVAARHGYPWTAADWAAIRGTSTWGGYLAERCGIRTPESAVGECVDGMVAALARREFGLLPGAADLVTAAAERGRVGLVSASPARYVHAAVAAFGLAPQLHAIVTGDDVVRGKPAPDPYLRAAELLGVAPAECVAVEDSASGIRSAHAAGMTVIAIPNATTALDFEALALAGHQAADAVVATKILTSATW